MSRRQGRTRRRPAAPVVVPAVAGPGWWGLAKAVLVCGAAGGLIGAAIGAALRTGGYALPAALAVGLPAGAVGAGALGWYGRRLGRVKRLRHGTLVGAGLGLIGVGTIGAVAGLSVWALPWSLGGSVLGALVQSEATRPDRRPLGLFPGLVIGGVAGILVGAVRRGPDAVRAGASEGAVLGAVVGVLVIPALLAWLAELPGLLRRRRKRR